VKTERFGVTSDGATVSRAVIGSDKLSASVLDWGATIQDLRLAGHDVPLVLGYGDFAPYEANENYFGAVAGRYANRIANGRFRIDGEQFQAERNYLGKHTLHGGFAGYVHRLWTVDIRTDDSVELTLHDPSGRAGFPGNLQVRCVYRVTDTTLRMEATATADRPTLCNLAQHSYFNLDDGGAGDALDHSLVLKADAYTPVDEELIPTGKVEPVDGTRFDFRTARTIRAPKDGDGELFDHNFCLRSDRGPLRQAAWAQGAKSGVEMEVWTTEPGLQLYSGQYIKGQARGLLGTPYKPSAGFCLEPQVWPDSPNRDYFPQAVLRPGETYRQVTEWRFRLP
jgi:aldose 1-epimerase